MDRLQDEFAASYPDLAVSFVGVNAAGLEQGNAFITEGKDIPWLQDVDADDNGQSDVWENWGKGHLDVVVLDEHNVPVSEINVVQNSLSDPGNYATLRQMVLDAVSLSAPSSLDLLPIADTGTSTSDNVTRWNNGSPETAWQLLVGGVTPGATVEIEANGQIVGSATAADTEVTITTDGQHVLGDGLVTLRAIQSLANRSSDPSAELAVTVDATIEDFDSFPPTVLTANEAFNYDAQHPEENQPGFLYSLDEAPADMTLDPVSGTVYWVPTTTDEGLHELTITARDRAGNQRQQHVDLVVVSDDGSDVPPPGDGDQDDGGEQPPADGDESSQTSGSRLSGHVFIDADNDGRRDDGELALGHVTITLTGIDESGQSIERVTRTAADGSYTFEGLPAGNYVLVESQPDHLLDGLDIAGNEGGELIANDRIRVALGAGVDATGYDFAERGLRAEAVSIYSFLSSTPKRMITAAATPDGCHWYTATEDWGSITSADFQGDAASDNVEVRIVESEARTMVRRLPKEASRWIRTSREPGRGDLVQFALSPIEIQTPAEATAGSPGSGGEAEGESRAMPTSTPEAGFFEADVSPRTVPVSDSALPSEEVSRDGAAPIEWARAAAALALWDANDDWPDGIEHPGTTASDSPYYGPFSNTV